MDLRQEVFDRVLHQDAQFFENNESGNIMSALMMDIDRIQVSVSTMLADWLRQIFHGHLPALRHDFHRLEVVACQLARFPCCGGLDYGHGPSHSAAALATRKIWPRVSRKSFTKPSPATKS